MKQNKQKKNMGHSVFTRLKTTAKQQEVDLNFILKRYGTERLLYHMSKSSYAKDLILKGGTLFLAWQGKSYRVTYDIDLLRFDSSEVSDLEQIFREICDIEVEDDGIIFHADTVKGELKNKNAHYPVMEIKIHANILTANVDLKIDIGFGDFVTPATENITYPTLLDMPKPELRAYPRYTVVSEKFEAMVSLGMRNSRLKDFYDIWAISKIFRFEGKVLYQAIKNTFNQRGSQFPDSVPFAFTEEFYTNKQESWSNFLKNYRVILESHIEFEDVIKAIAHFLMPIVEAIQKEQEFTKIWDNDRHLWVEVEN